MGLFSGKFFEGVTLKGVLDSGVLNPIVGRESEPVYQAQVTGSTSFGQKQGQNTMLYMCLGGVGLVLVMFMMRK